jgi:7-cyano-7-deazaguanine synthase
MKKSVVLLSGGLDSTVNLFEAAKVSQVILGLTFDYGQRACDREIEASKFFCDQLKIPHRVLQVHWFKDFTSTSLVDHSKAVPRSMNLGDDKALELTGEAVWVPNRNGIILNIAAGFAEGLKAQWVVPGFNKEEALTFPDNSETFIDSMNKTLAFSTNNRVEVKCFTSGLQKVEIVDRAMKIGIDLEKLWPCYNDEETLCGECESCLRFRRAYHLWKNSQR